MISYFGMSALCLSMMVSNFFCSSFLSSPALSFMRVSRVSANHLFVSALSRFLHNDYNKEMSWWNIYMYCMNVGQVNADTHTLIITLTFIIMNYK